MDIKRSFKHFKKNYIRESEVLDNEDFVDVDLEGTTEDTTGKVYTIEVASVITDEDSDAQNVQTYENVTAEELIEKLGEEKANEFFANREITVDFPFDDAGFFDSAEEYAWYIESESDSDSGIEYTDPEENLDAGYDTDFNESHKCRKGKSLITEATPIVNAEVLDTNTGDDIVYEIGIYYKKNGRQPDFTLYPDKTVRYTFDEMIEKFGSQCAEDIIMNNSHDTNNIYYKLENVEYANSDNDIDESCCCGGKKKCRKGKSLITEATPIVNAEVLDTNTGDDIVYEIGIYYKKNGRQPDFTLYPDKTVRYTFDEMIEKFGSQCAEDIIMNNSHDTNNIYYKLENVEYANSDNDIDESCCCGGKKKSKKGKKDKKSKFVPFWAKKKDKELKEALKTLKDAGYSIINECGVDCELEDDATGFGIAFDDSDYYTEGGECEVCAICGKESCDGEYDEDGNFVCSDCAENSLEQPMEEIDPMDIYFRAGRADNIRDMHRFDR